MHAIVNQESSFKKSMKKLFILITLFALFIPVLTKAASLVPCGLSEDDPDTPMINETTSCTACDLLVLFQNILKFALEIAFLIVIGFIAYGGFRWIFSGGNEANIKAGQQIMTNAIIGLLIILCAWLIVNTVFWLIETIGGDDYTGTWFKIECTYPATNPDNGNGNGDGMGDGGNGNGDGGGDEGGGAIENWCGDMGYACVENKDGLEWRLNCADDTVVIWDINVSHCPPEAPVCCLPRDESKIKAEPKNPEPPNPGGPCANGAKQTRCIYNYCKAPCGDPTNVSCTQTYDFVCPGEESLCQAKNECETKTDCAVTKCLSCNYTDNEIGKDLCLKFEYYTPAKFSCDRGHQVGSIYNSQEIGVNSKEECCSGCDECRER